MISTELLWLALAISNLLWGFLYFCKSMDLAVAEQRLEELRAIDLAEEGWRTTYYMGRKMLIPPPPPRPKVKEIKEDSPKPLESPTSDLNKELVESIQQTKKLLKKTVKQFQKTPVIEEKFLEEMDEKSRKDLVTVLTMDGVKVKYNFTTSVEQNALRHRKLGEPYSQQKGDYKSVTEGYIVIEREF